MAEPPPTFTEQLEVWERATRERGTEPASRGISHEPHGRGTRGTAARKKATPQQRRAQPQQRREFQAALKPPTPREQELDRLEREMQRKSRELAGSVAGAAADAIVSSHQKIAVPATSKKWEDGKWGVGFGSTWASAEAGKAANRALGRPEGTKPTPEELKNPKSKYAVAFWAARERITQQLAGLREMTCLTMMNEPLRAYVGAAGRLAKDKGEREERLDDVMKKAKDARGVDEKMVEEARGTVVLEELRTQFGFETVHVDAAPKDPAQYWNKKSYSSDADAHNKDRRLPRRETLRKVEGADSHEEVDVSVGIDHFVKLGKKLSPESRKWWDVLNQAEFAVGVADQGYHTFAISRGYVYEVHWDRGPDNPTLTDKRSLKDFFNPNSRHGGTKWGSGIIAVPPGALPKSRRPE